MADHRNKLLVVDDMSSNRAYLCKIFSEQYEVLEAEDGEEAVEIISEHHESLAVILLDIVMPVRDGYYVLKEMSKRGFLPQIPVVIITSDSSKRSEARALDMGALDIIVKPFEPYVVRRRVQNIIDRHSRGIQLQAQIDELTMAMNVTNDTIVNTLATITEFRSLESGQHILRIRGFTSMLLAEVARSFPEYELDDKRIATISSAAVLHDIGKISIPDAILNKPGRLTSEEFEIMKTHTTAGCQILDSMTGVVDREYMHYAYNICRYHHERWDGRGYPDGLKGDNIPICAQVVALADVYDALTTKRVYKDAISYNQAVNMILNGECGTFNPRLIECFKNVREEFANYAQKHADGAPEVMEDLHVPMPPPRRTADLTTQQMASFKYHTLLNYVGGLVLEADVLNGTYHRIFDSNEAFLSLKNCGSLEETILSMIWESVHPDDMGAAIDQFEFMKNGFFDEGLRRHSQRYRVRGSQLTDYCWCECTILRIDTGNPGDRRVILIWKPADDESTGQTSDIAGDSSYGSVMRELMSHVIICRDDRWMTVTSGAGMLASMLGYAEAELDELFRCRLMEMIDPGDSGIVADSMREQFNRSNTAEVEYRLRCKDGSALWVLDKSHLISGKDGVQYICRMILDNTPSKNAQEKLRRTLERHQVLLNQIHEVILEWNTDSDSVSFSPNFERIFGYQPNTTGLGRRILDGSVRVHPDDLENLREQLGIIMDGRGTTSYISTEFRIANAEGAYMRCRLSATALQKENGRTDRFIGILTNIDEEKHAPEDLSHKAERDSLTKLLNRVEGQRQIVEYLKNRLAGERAALMIIDLDNFNLVNQRYGHMAGDTVLMRSASILNRYFPNEDIIARIGGDEFMVLLKSIPGQSFVDQRCQRVIAAFTDELTRSMPDCSLSCSIGVALAPDDADTYQELFQRADRAMLRAKEQGKNQYLFYDLDESLSSDYSAAHAPIESDEIPGLADQSLIHYAFTRLYESGDVEATIRSLLELIGRQMNVSRVYIFENSADNKYCNNTFEWCNDGIEPQIDELQGLCYDTDIKGYREFYDSSSVFHCRNVADLPEHLRALLDPQGTLSMLHCAIRDGGIFRGFVGFDECKVNRTWTKEQIDMLSRLAEFTAVFLMKKRAQDAGEQWSKSLECILDNQNSWIYVIDPDTCEIKFINSKAKEFVPYLNIGQQCFRSIMCRETRCENCPALNIRETKNQRTEISNKHLRINVTSEAKLISWNGEDAALIICDPI